MVSPLILVTSLIIRVTQFNKLVSLLIWFSFVNWVYKPRLFKCVVLEHPSVESKTNRSRLVTVNLCDLQRLDNFLKVFALPDKTSHFCTRNYLTVRLIFHQCYQLLFLNVFMLLREKTEDNAWVKCGSWFVVLG